MTRLKKKIIYLIIILLAVTALFGSATSLFAQRATVTPPRVQGQTPIGTINGVPVTGNDIITLVNHNSPFMPPLDDEPIPVIKDYETNYQPTPNPAATPSTPPRAAATSFGLQINNMMKTGQDWLFNSLLNVIVKPFLPFLVFFAWIIASFVLALGFLRRFSDNKGVSPEQLVRWGIRTVIFMVLIGASPYLIDILTTTGKFIARPVKGFNAEMIKEFDQKMIQYVKKNFAVEDPNSLLAERLPNGEPGLVGVIFDKESNVKDVTAQMNPFGWDLTKLFTLMVVAQNIIKFGSIFLAIAGLFILIGLKLAAPMMTAFGFDEKFAQQIFYPFCWGVATFSLAFPIVKEGTVYLAYGIGLIALSIYNNEPVYTLDPTTAQIITNGNYDPASSALIVTLLFFVASLCYILVPWLSYRILRGQVFEGVSQVSMGWMLSTVGTALETYGLVAGAAINRQAENTQIQGIYSAEQTSAKAAFDAGKLQADARRTQSLAGVQGGLQSTLGQIYGSQTTNILMTNANRQMQLQQTLAATQREIGSQRIDMTDKTNRLGFEAAKEKGTRFIENGVQAAEYTLDMIPGGKVASSRGTAGNVALQLGIAPTQIRETAGNLLTDEQYQLHLGQNSRTLGSQRENSQAYQYKIESSINQNADANISAINKGAAISAGAAQKGAAIQSGGIKQAYNLEMQANQVTLTGRNEAALISKNASEEAAHLRMVSTVVTGFFRDMDRRLEEMKPKY
ncbi:MAG TPA: hypothetical protein PKY82_07350 [Pyrinomonadaceae bacterium]|nr:hypothetical protein [Pyrinomonadaceae bacterium]